jgi:hypothetical protein
MDRGRKTKVFTIKIVEICPAELEIDFFFFFAKNVYLQFCWTNFNDLYGVHLRFMSSI